MPFHRPRFKRAIDSQFEHLGRPAEYRRADAVPKEIRVIARRPESLFELGDSAIHGELPQLEFRISDIENPKRGDTIRLGQTDYRLEAEPELERHQLVWVAASLRVTNSSST